MQTFTFTFSESVENHVGMQQIGQKASKGLSFKQLIKISEQFDPKSIEIYSLDSFLNPEFTSDETKS